MYLVWNSTELHLAESNDTALSVLTLCTKDTVDRPNMNSIEELCKGMAWDKRPPMCAKCRKMAEQIVTNMTAALWRESQPA